MNAFSISSNAERSLKNVHNRFFPLPIAAARENAQPSGTWKRVCKMQEPSNEIGPLRNRETDWFIGRGTEEDAYVLRLVDN